MTKMLSDALAEAFRILDSISVLVKNQESRIAILKRQCERQAETINELETELRKIREVLNG